MQGINQIMSYIGLPASFFTLHKEDGDLASISYLVQGKAK